MTEKKTIKGLIEHKCIYTSRLKQIEKAKNIIKEYQDMNDRLFNVSTEINIFKLKIFNLDKIIIKTNNEELFELRIKEREKLNNKIHLLREERIDLNSELNKPSKGLTNLYTKYTYSLTYLKLFDNDN